MRVPALGRPHLRVVAVDATGVCDFCLREMPLSELKLLPGGAVCEDSADCVQEVQRQESSGWKDHPRVAV